MTALADFIRQKQMEPPSERRAAELAALELLASNPDEAARILQARVLALSPAEQEEFVRQVEEGLGKARQ